MGPGDRMDSAKLEFERLQLAPLVALSAHLPLPDRVRADLARFAPRGTLTHGRLRWSGNGRCADHLRRDRRVRGCGAPRAGRIPGSHRAFRPVRGHERRRRNQGRERQRDARPPARARGAARVRHVAERDQVGAPRRQHEGEGRAARGRQRRHDRRRHGNVSHAADRARRNRGRRPRVARRRRGRSTAICRDRSTRPRGGWLERRAGRRQRGRRETQDRRQPRRLSVRQRQGRQAHVHHEGEGGEARLRAGLARDRCHRRRREDRRHATAGRRRARAGQRRGDRQDARGDSGLRRPRPDAADRRRGDGARSPAFSATSTRVPSRRASERSRATPRRWAAASWRSRSVFRSGGPRTRRSTGSSSSPTPSCAFRARRASRSSAASCRSPDTKSARATSRRRSSADRRGSP